MRESEERENHELLPPMFVHMRKKPDVVNEGNVLSTFSFPRFSSSLLDREREREDQEGEERKEGPG